MEDISLLKRSEFEKEIEILNQTIQDDNLLQQKLDEQILKREIEIKSYLLPSIMTGRYISALVRRKLFGNIYELKDALVVKNKLNCESHLELLQRLFSILIK